MSLNIIETYLTPNGEPRKGNRPLFLILFSSERSGCSIYDLDREDKYENGKTMFRGHFFISKEGVIFRGRSLDTIGEFAHDDQTGMDFNRNSIGICVEGDYTSELMPTIQKNSIVLLIQYLRNNNSTLKTIYALDEILTDKSNPGIFFPLNEIIANVLNVSIEPVRKAPNGLLRYAFGNRTLYFDSKKPITGNDVTELQTMLNLFGFNCDTNGYFDNNTMLAVLNFQKSYNLIPDGIVNDETFSLIKKLSLKFFENRMTFSRILYFDNNNQLYGNDIKRLQNRLQLLGYECNSNGFYDSSTESAVKNFQESHSLTVDGKVGPITWSQITDTSFTFIKRTLMYTTPMLFGDDVRLVQQRLNDLGYILEPTGWFDETTMQAVIKFQSSKGMKADGIINDSTAKQLFK